MASLCTISIRIERVHAPNTCDLDTVTPHTELYTISAHLCAPADGVPRLRYLNREHAIPLRCFPAYKNKEIVVREKHSYLIVKLICLFVLDIQHMMVWSSTIQVHCVEIDKRLLKLDLPPLHFFRIKRHLVCPTFEKPYSQQDYRSLHPDNLRLNIKVHQKYIHSRVMPSAYDMFIANPEMALDGIRGEHLRNYGEVPAHLTAKLERGERATEHRARRIGDGDVQVPEFEDLYQNTSLEETHFRSADFLHPEMEDGDSDGESDLGMEEVVEEYEAEE